MPSSSGSPSPAQGGYRTPTFDDAMVADVMHVGIVTASPDAPPATVARMTHLVVTDGDARPIGVHSTLDVAGVVAWGRA
jgi:hypothetical protein